MTRHTLSPLNKLIKEYHIRMDKQTNNVDGTKEAIETIDSIDVEQWITKIQACEILEVSERAIQRHAQKGTIRVIHSRHGGSRPEAFYNKADILGLKYRVETPRQTPPSTPSTNTSDQAIVKGSKKGIAVLPEAPKEFRSKFDVRIAEKLTLSIREAAALSGLYGETLKAAIIDGKLKAFPQGRSKRIKRHDLEAFILELS